VARRKRPVSDTTYTGLRDTATGFSGSSTLDSSVEIGSPLQLVMSHDRNAPGSPDSRFTVSTYDLWDNPNASDSLALSGVSDPPFASAGLSTPFPLAVQPGQTINNALQGQSKFGSGLATLMGKHPITQSSSPSSVHGARSRAVPVESIPSGHFTLAVVVIVMALGLLLLNGSGGGSLE
jgi:hypothetical protein